MKQPPVRLEGFAPLYARLALGAAFLSAVAARFGLWDHRPQPFRAFIGYTDEVLSCVPSASALLLGREAVDHR